METTDVHAGWKVCVQYNELIEDGTASDPDSGFEACAAVGGGLIDLTRGTTSKIAPLAFYGQGNGWNESGYFPKANGALWGQFIFWSNSSTRAPASRAL